MIGWVVMQTGFGDLLGWRVFSSLPVILAIAWIAGRLLGVRRSVGVTLFSGFAGWFAGAGLAVVIARNQGQSGGFTRDLWLFSIVFTMSATVWIELLAKPGALARAQTGLRSIPRPMRALRRRSRRVSRYVQITRIAARHGLGPYLGLGTRGGDDEAIDGRAPPARRLRLALEECGGMFVKLGQVLSTRSDLLPQSFVHELSRLLDRVPPVSAEEVRPLLEAELGAPVSEVFAELCWEPVAAASIGQAHRGRLLGGEEVIVKIQRPGIAEAVERDIEVVLELARTVEARTTWASSFHVADLAQEFTDRLREELDFRTEARNADDIARLSKDGGIRIPRVHAELSTAKVLVMEWMDGLSIRDSHGLDSLGVDRHELADTLLRGSLQQMIVDGCFHADPHPGNVMVLQDGCLALIDFGAVGHLDALEQASLREMMIAVSLKDAAVLRQAVLEVASFRKDLDDEQLERALSRFMARHLGPGATPSAAMFNELLSVLFSFGIALPPSFATFFRALVTLEGTLTTLSPGYPVIGEAQTVAGEWAGQRLTAISLEELARKELVGLAPILRRVPRHVDRLATIVERGNLAARVSLFSGDRDVRVVTKLVNRIVLAVLGGIVGIVSGILLGTPGGPVFTGSTSLFQFFGYFGLFCSAVLIMRVIVAVLQDGLN
jgi:ubiquinone biosynthesis protein